MHGSVPCRPDTGGTGLLAIRFLLLDVQTQGRSVPVHWFNRAFIQADDVVF